MGFLANVLNNNANVIILYKILFTDYMLYIEDFDHPDITALSGSNIHLYIRREYPKLYDYIESNKGIEKFSEYLYRMYHHIPDRPVCVVCGNPVKFKTFHIGYGRTCGRACTAKDPATILKAKQTMLEKYGVDNISKLKEIHEKKRINCIQKYGVDSPNKVDSIKEKQHHLKKIRTKKDPDEIKLKREQTMLERYGVSHYTNREKCKATTKAHFGVESVFQLPEKQNEICDIKEKKYGDRYYTNREKYKQTSLKQYGVEWGINTKENQDKARETTINRYGVPFTFMSYEFQKEIQKKIESKYGVKSPSKLQSIKEQTKRTCQKKYGVDWPCQRPEARNYSNNSGPNKKFSELLDKHNIQYEREFVLDNYSYDFKVDDILIEINPWATHNIDWSPFNHQIDKNYHKNKTNHAVSKGYKCICVWDWDDMNMIIRMFLTQKKRIFARNCLCMEVSKTDTLNFLKSYHIQGTCRGIKISVGIYYNNELVGIMCWGKPRYSKKSSYELLRMCYKDDILVIGGTKKIFKYFVEKYHPESIVSYCDNSKFTGNIYHELGFKHKSNTSPSIHWINSKGIHITNNLLNQRGYDQLFGTSFGKYTSNQQLMLDTGFVRIYDCGQATYVWDGGSHK